MKSVCSIHEQAYDVGERCPYCEEPEVTLVDAMAVLSAQQAYALPAAALEQQQAEQEAVRISLSASAATILKEYYSLDPQTRTVTQYVEWTEP